MSKASLSIGKFFDPGRVALLLLVAQTVGSIITLRASRLTKGSDGLTYLSTTAVLLTEVLKLMLSALLVWRASGYSFLAACSEVDNVVFQNPLGTLKVGVVALLYTIQNNLIFIALSNMSPAFYQITYQLKILSTAFLSVLLLKRILSPGRWCSLVILTVGVILIQMPVSGESKSSSIHEGNFMVGLTAVLCACFTSGLAGVFFEKILKTSGHISVWVRNIQLALLSSVIACIGVLWNDWKAVKEDGFLQGYTKATWAAIILQGVGGLIVAAVLKYADNILKCFGNALAIILSCIFSLYLFGDFTVTIYFLIGTALVCIASYTYGVDFNFGYITHPKSQLKGVPHSLAQTEMTVPPIKNNEHVV